MALQDRSGSSEGAGSQAIELGPLAGVAGFGFRRIQNRLTATFTQALAPYNLRPGTFSCLSIISSNPGLSQSELAECVGIDKTKIMQILDELERRGLAQRARSTADRRCHALHLTVAGEKLAGELLLVVQAAEATVLGELTGAERKALMGLLNKIVATMG